MAKLQLWISLRARPDHYKVTKVSNPNVSSGLTQYGLIPEGRSGSIEPK
jgi:hypothetical protein